ncbi:MAG: hypothetical protein GWM98_21530, partial [Nitrospinaceae bacterium]|nr:hypothetical protein [Nitrospinaceae bacterium]NIR56566.1 hypothetical protein [Nitrospinaceae bacterium]NIS87028.1 hypothetical protein [Nitrospinaceae bacterium]NIT83872.1 hypothetical protein [Nitrospinaceae bacterium]NIU46075.1 hypothetical protein [Nitrospinaceae bacterium]
GFKLQDPDLVAAVTGPRPNWVQTHGNGHGSQEVSIIGYSPLPYLNALTRQSTGETWFTFAWQASEEVFSPMTNLFMWISAAGIVSVILIAVMGSMASGTIV